jgi:UDP-glucose 4-epimerase
MEVVRAVEEVTGKKVPLEFGPRREGDAPVLVANSNKLKATLGWKPKYPELDVIVQTAWHFSKRNQGR